MINIKLTGQFAELAPEGSEKGSFAIAFETGLTLSVLMERLGVEGGTVKYVALVNNSRKPANFLLADSDSVTVMPLLAGG
ncbi:MAG: MoaD/ThiS family protein [Treponema sp.]|nr:MoaD/ThiS family protein [Treponema sp.]